MTSLTTPPPPAAAAYPGMSQLTFTPATPRPRRHLGPLVTTALIVGLVAMVEAIVLMSVAIVGSFVVGAAILHALSVASSAVPPSGY